MSKLIINMNEYGQGELPVDVNLDEHKTPEAMAKAVYEALKKVVTDFGQDPEWELSIRNPEEADAHGIAKAWWVCWEAGPSSWGIGASFCVGAADTPVWCETHYGFDLIFWDEEA